MIFLEGGVQCEIVRWMKHMRKRLAWRPTETEIVRVVQDHLGVGCEELRQVRRHGNDARVATLYLIRRLTDEKVTTMANGQLSLAKRRSRPTITRHGLRRGCGSGMGDADKP